MNTTSVHLAQDAKRTRPDVWKWSVWVEGDNATLDSIDHVVYLLHSSFPKPERTISNRAAKFRLDSSGWGEFVIRAKVVFKNGSSVQLSHRLRLSGGDPAEQWGVFISYSSTDRQLAAAVGQELKAHGIGVLDTASSAGSNVPLGAQLRRAFDDADVVLTILGDRASPWVEQETALAGEYDLPVIEFLPHGPSSDDVEIYLDRPPAVARVYDVAGAVNAVIDVLKKQPPPVV